MKTKTITYITFLTLALLCGACKNKAVDYYLFEIKDEHIQAESTNAVISGAYSFRGEVNGMKFNLGTNENLSDALTYDMLLEGDEFSITLDSLIPNTTYYYCYNVDFGMQKDYLTEVNSFKTLRGAPTVKTVEAIAINLDSYQVKCEVVSDGGDAVSERGIYWNTNGNPGVNDHKVKHAENGMGEYTCIMENLVPHTKYFVRAYAKNDKGMGFGNVIDFEIGVASPRVKTLEPTDIKDTSAVGHGMIEYDGGGTIIRSGICWNTREDPTIFHDFVDNNDNEGEFSVSINGLSPETVYFVRAYAINEIDTVYGDNKSFKTNSGGGPDTPVTVVVNASPTIIPEGETSQLTALASGGDGNYSYSWTPFASLNNPNTQSPTASPVVTTTYTCTVTSNNNTASNSCTITVVKAPTNLIAINQNGNDVRLNWTNANPAQTYKVYRNDTYIAQTVNTTYMDSNLSPGTYKYQVTTLYEGVESPKSNIEIVEIALQIPEGAMEHLFTVGFNNKQIWFSKGNLWYKASPSPSTWRFAENQYDYIGGNNSNISQNYNDWIDLFGWGTSGYEHGAYCSQPWSISEQNSDYYAYGNPTNNLNTQSGKADWGYNAIANGGNEEHKGWRTLTNSEWNYLLNQRQTTSNIRYAKAMVEDVSGLIILPDDWNVSFFNLNNPNESGSNYDSNKIDAYIWTTELEAHGAVFLPAGGRRSKTGMGDKGIGYYWSSIQNGESDAYYLYFKDGVLNAMDSDGRHYGLMVRLVFDKP